MKKHNISSYELEIVSGGAKGIDSCAKEFAMEHGLGYKEFPADWDKHGKAAGPIRNREMADYADALLLIWTGMSKGSMNMLKVMTEADKVVFEEFVTGDKK